MRKFLSIKRELLSLLQKRASVANLRQFLGIQLASTTFIAAVLVPQVDALSSQLTVMQETVYTVVEATIAEAKYRWPLTVFGISQRFSLFHPGMDLTDPKGTPIHPVADGVVVMAQKQRVGYGNHIMVEHPDGVKSLYAHLSTLAAKPGDTVSKDGTLGEVGATGWSTGTHLHLEIYQDGTPVNPVEVLPALTPEK